VYYFDANDISCLKCDLQVVYILDQVRALEKEMLLRMEKQGLDVDPKILIVSLFAC
jgi:sucrose synthase